MDAPSLAAALLRLDGGRLGSDQLRALLRFAPQSHELADIAAYLQVGGQGPGVPLPSPARAAPCPRLNPTANPRTALLCAPSCPKPQGTHERYRGRSDPSHLGPVERYFMEVGVGRERSAV